MENMAPKSSLNTVDPSIIISSSLNPAMSTEISGREHAEGDNKLLGKHLLDIPISLSSIYHYDVTASEPPLPSSPNLGSKFDSSVSSVPVEMPLPVETVVPVSVADSNVILGTTRGSSLVNVSPSAVHTSVSMIAVAPVSSSSVVQSTSTPSLSSTAAARTSLGLKCTLNFNPSTGLYDLVASWTMPAYYLGRIQLFFCELSVHFLTVLKSERILIEVCTN